MRLVDCKQGGLFELKDDVLYLMENNEYKMGGWGNNGDEIYMATGTIGVQQIEFDVSSKESKADV
jgi:hypothetical protein